MIDIFEKIIKKEIPSEIIYEDDCAIAILDINPINEGHFLVIPKKISTNFMDIDDSTLGCLMKKTRELANAKIKDMNVSGYKIIINNGKESGQEVFRTHVHVIPSKK